jgi:hypothetical protein
MHPLTVYEIAVREHAQATERRAQARLHDSRRSDRPASPALRRAVRKRRQRRSER